MQTFFCQSIRSGCVSTLSPYDYHWITRKYLPRIVVLCESLKKGAMPSLKDVPRLVIPEW